MTALLDEARSLEAWLVAVRRDIHRHPELGFAETRTAALVARELEELGGLEVRRHVGVTGVVADLVTGDGPTVALRADMDALPIQEEGDHDYRSVVPGVMHACGHDAHTAGLLGAARLLTGLEASGELPPGTVRFIFQPSEERADDEGMSGALRMIESGAMADVDAVVGLHVGGHLPAGRLFLSPGTVLAGAEELTVDVFGKSSHAARPHEGVDALALTCLGVVAVQQAVSRRISPMEHGVVTFGRIEGGGARNVVADHVRLEGTLRYFTESVREQLVQALIGTFEGLEHHGTRVDVQVGPGYPPLVNDVGVTSTLEAALGELTGDHGVLPQERVMGAEDFAFLAREAPACFIWLGAALPEPREHHHPRFDIDDSVLPLGAAALARSAVALLDDR